MHIHKSSRVENVQHIRRRSGFHHRGVSGRRRLKVSSPTLLPRFLAEKGRRSGRRAHKAFIFNLAETFRPLPRRWPILLSAFTLGTGASKSLFIAEFILAAKWST